MTESRPPLGFGTRAIHAGEATDDLLRTSFPLTPAQEASYRALRAC